MLDVKHVPYQCRRVLSCKFAGLISIVDLTDSKDKRDSLGKIPVQMNRELGEIC